jgi:branched-chain amino acid transport system substrate-binding protein
MQKRTALATLLLAGMCWTGVAHAQDTIKVGVILPYSGPFADSGNQLQAGIDLYLARNGNTVAGKTVEIIRKDTGGPAPDVAQRLAQELVVRDGVDIIAGFVMTPNALGAAPVATEAQKLMVVMNAATSIITEKSEYIVRTGLTIPQLIQAYGAWAFEKGGIKTAYTLVADFGPGHDAEASFAKGFTDAGGTILGADDGAAGDQGARGHRADNPRGAGKSGRQGEGLYHGLELLAGEPGSAERRVRRRLSRGQRWPGARHLFGRRL